MSLTDSPQRTAVVLMNLGGPDRLAAVTPFLFNLFRDPAIVNLPGVLRLPLAALLAASRARAARDIYTRLGGASPLLENTRAQATALEAALGPAHRCFVAMRYWHPTSAEAARLVGEWRPDRIVSLPLYPQFSTTTTASSLAAWRSAAARAGLSVPTCVVSSYPEERGFIQAIASLIRPELDRLAGGGMPARLLLTAHGLPQRIVARGDPYPEEIGRTATAIVAALGSPGLDWRVSYQSRVGPLEWLGPATDDEIRRAGRERLALVVAPIAFVSEHSETLVELDLDYRQIAKNCGVPDYVRVATVGTSPAFIAALADLVRRAEAGDCGGSS